MSKIKDRVNYWYDHYVDFKYGWRSDGMAGRSRPLSLGSTQNAGGHYPGWNPIHPDGGGNPAPLRSFSGGRIYPYNCAADGTHGNRIY